MRIRCDSNNIILYKSTAVLIGDRAKFQTKSKFCRKPTKKNDFLNAFGKTNSDGRTSADTDADLFT